MASENDDSSSKKVSNCQALCPNCHITCFIEESRSIKTAYFCYQCHYKEPNSGQQDTNSKS